MATDVLFLFQQVTFFNQRICYFVAWQGNRYRDWEPPQEEYYDSSDSGIGPKKLTIRPMTRAHANAASNPRELRFLKIFFLRTVLLHSFLIYDLYKPKNIYSFQKRAV